MKRLLFLLLGIGLSFLVSAQVSAPIITSNVASQKVLSDRSYTFNVGSPIPYLYNGNATHKLQVGFPYNVLYMGETFKGNLFVSKGYFPNQIQLSWQLLGNDNRIARFEIYRKKIGENDSVWVESLNSSFRKWVDNYCDANAMYEYTLLAVGIPGEKRIGYTHLTGVGFRMPLATVTGRVSYSSGSPVSNVTITASTTDNVPSNSIALSAASHLEMPFSDSIDFSGGFTFQSYLKFSSAADAGIFNKASNFGLNYTSNAFVFTVGSQSVQLPFVVPIDSFVHITAVYTGDSAMLYIPYKIYTSEGQVFDSLLTAKAKITNSISPNNHSIQIGRNGTSFFNGNIDEVRLWSIALSPEEIRRDYNRYISGKETGFFAYIRINEGFGTNAYDISKAGSVFNEHHVRFVGAGLTWSTQVPTLEQLGHRGITDEEGNYIVSGIPFQTEGSAYKFTPMMAPHYFEPAYKIVFLSESSSVHNNIDFTDLASVSVSLNVVYNTGTGFPVSDVLIKVDGTYLTDANNELVKTKEDGKVTFRVPIGHHYLSFEKNGHTFATPHFPARDSAGNIVRHLFNKNIPLLEILDTTRVVLAGRIVGGPVEAAKTLGSKKDPSENNIGVVNVTLTTEKGYDLDADGTPKTITFSSDPETGEFSVTLIPEKFKPAGSNAVGNSHYVFNTDADLALIDLSNQFFMKYETDSLFKKNNLDEIVFDRLDTVSAYNLRKDWTYRADPSLEIKNLSGGNIISDKHFVYAKGAVTDSILLSSEDNLGNVTHNFGLPIFTFARQYSTQVEAFEEYINHDKTVDNVNRVPVTDGLVIINNDLALENKQQQIKLNSEGELSYSFTADFPNIADPYTKFFNLTLKTKSKTVQLNPMEAYILGGRPTGNNFVTTGPNEVDFILRDPPGSNSSAFLEKGYTSSTTKTSAVSHGEEVETQLAYQMGVRIATSAGTPFFQMQNEFDTDNFLGIKVEQSYNEKSEYETKSSTTFNERFATSDDPSFVGSAGDVFIGHSSNIVYGISKIMQIMPKTDVPSYSDTISKYGNYAISIENGLRVNPEFNTMFVYSQTIIEEEMIPHLEYLRNIIIEGPYYTKVFTDIDDPRYASNNDADIWSTTKSAKTDSGPSYIFNPPASANPFEFPVDSVRFYNNQIKGWKKVLARNEEEKTKAKPDDKHKNISFGAGSTYESYIATEYDTTWNDSWEFSIAPGIATSIGFSANKFGFRFDLEAKYTHTSEGSDGGDSTSTKTIGYSLIDSDAQNYLTVDVKKCQSGNGPVFVTRGGQTSCPYEGEELTEYYQPGLHTLSHATMKIDGPQLSCTNPVSPVIPETSPAYFTLNLSNISEAEKDNWYIIGVDVGMNPYGAKVKMDGATMNDGIAVFVPYGKTVTKTIEVYKGRADINTYENLGVYLRSQCQEDIADTVFLTAYFASACSPVSFIQPANNWVINTNDRDTMLVVISGYNLQHTGFTEIQFQYKPSTGSTWTLVQVFTNDSLKATKPGITYIGTQTTLNYLWDMRSLMDRAYDIQLVTFCEDGSQNFSKTLSGVLDGQRPQVFGSPQPADGILDIDDNISIQFNEPIEKGLLIPANFKVAGTINNGSMLHEAYLRFNGLTDYAVIPEGISFNDKSFTIEFWVRPDLYGNAVLFSQGADPATSLEIGLRPGYETYFKIGNVTFDAPFQFSTTVPSTDWQHMAYVFDYENKDVFIYHNDNIILERRGVNITFNNAGKIYLAKSAVTGGDYAAGSMHDLRIWSKILSIGDVYANQDKMLTGNEVGLYGYWQMNEAFGNLVADKAANRHMEVFAPWETYPGGSAWNFNGNNYLKFNTGYFAIIPEMDYTVEFWFKADNPSDTVCFFSNQRGDGKESLGLTEKALSIYASPDGKIWVVSKGNVFEAVTTDFFDNSWHHFALTLRRRGNVISFIDGQVQNENENTILGGIAGGEMHLGVRKWNNMSGSGEDRYFTGKMDEFRLWNLAKTRMQIQLDMTSKLKGDEIGLMAYFPFESYYKDAFGMMTQQQTLENFVPDVNATNAIPASSATYSTDAPNMKDVRPVQNIAFSFVSSDDKIIINPEAYLLPQLEKNIVEITVQGVEDKFGNRLASPVTWTAYVHRNQVRWEDERRSFTKELYKTTEFVASIKNTGGQQVGFSISGLPAWLSASPSSGNLNPESTREITFTINPALNIGEYSHDILLHTENGFNESLPISVKVYKIPPKWTVDPTQFEYTMNMVGRVKIENVLSTDVFDMVVAFKKGTSSIRGVANVRYLKAFDSYLVFLNVYGNVTGEELEFRIWDASAGQIIDNVSPFNVTFVPNGVKGTIANPVVFEATGLYRQYITLVKGWSWVSFNKLANNQNNLNSFLASLEPMQNDQIKSHGGGFNNFDVNTGWMVGGIDSIDNRRMYQIRLSNPDTLIYSGTGIVPENTPINLSAGWNHIAYLPDFAMDVNDALRYYVADTSEIIKSQYAFSMYDSHIGWVGTLDVMQPGVGYMFNTKKASALKYPNTTLFKSAIAPNAIAAQNHWGVNLSQYDGNMSVVARVTLRTNVGATVNENSILGAFIGSECHGESTAKFYPGLQEPLFFLPVGNNKNGDIVSYFLYDGNTGNTYPLKEKTTYATNQVYGSVLNPLELTFDESGLGTSEGSYNQMVRCYPNPFESNMVIEFSGYNQMVSIEIVNALGATIRTFEISNPAKGINRVVWEGTNQLGAEVAAGVYLIRILSESKQETIKISKARK